MYAKRKAVNLPSVPNIPRPHIESDPAYRDEKDFAEKGRGQRTMKGRKSSKSKGSLHNSAIIDHAQARAEEERTRAEKAMDLEPRHYASTSPDEKMDLDTFVSVCAQGGYASKNTARLWAKKQKKEVFSSEDLQAVYRMNEKENWDPETLPYYWKGRHSPDTPDMYDEEAHKPAEGAYDRRYRIGY